MRRPEFVATNYTQIVYRMVKESQKTVLDIWVDHAILKTESQRKSNLDL